MARISVSIDIDAPPSQVWRHAADLASHSTWMADAESIVFLTDRRSGVGTRMEVATRVGPFRTRDVMQVVDWVEERSIGVEHQGLVTGSGAFRLDPIGPATTRFTWSETLTFPWYLGGPVSAWFARPVLRWIWNRNLERFRSLF